MDKVKTIEEKKLEIDTAFTARKFNTLHGFHSEEGYHYVGIIQILRNDKNDPLRKYRQVNHRDIQILEERIKEKLKLVTPAIKFGDFIGNDYIKVKYESRAKIPDLINLLLEEGVTIHLQSGLNSFSYEPGDTFSLERSEELEIESLEKNYKEFPAFNILEDKVFSHGDPRLWKSEKGKAFALQLKKLFPYQETRFDSDKEIFLRKTDVDDPAIDYPML